MQFFESQFLRIENLLSYRARVDSREIGEMLSYMGRNLDALELEQVGNAILSISEVIVQENRLVFGIEILLPVNRPFVSEGQCVYKPVFLLENAVSARFVGEYREIPQIEEEVLSYAKQRRMQTITNVYYVVFPDKLFAAYVGINGNIV